MKKKRNTMNRRLGLGVITAASIGLILTFTTGSIARNPTMLLGNTRSNTTSFSQATSQPIVQPTIEFLGARETVVAVMNTMPTYTPYPHAPGVETKVVSEQRSELMAAAEKTVISMPDWVPLITREPRSEASETPIVPGPPTRTAGAGIIVENGYCGIDKLIGTHNKWREFIGTKRIGVCAGGTYAHTQHGLLVIVESDSTTDELLSGPDLYQVPANVAWVEVTDAVGERLTLKADTGEYFYFDVPTRQWVNP